MIFFNSMLAALTSLLFIALYTSIAGFNVISGLLFLIILAAFLFQKFKKVEFIPIFKSGLEIPILLTLFFAILAFIFNSDETSRFSNALYDLKILIGIFVYSAVIYKYGFTKKMYYVACFVALAISLQAILQYFFAFDLMRPDNYFMSSDPIRATGFFAHPNSFAFPAASLLIFFYIYTIRSFEQRKMNWGALALTLLLLTAVTITNTRIAWISMFCCLGFITVAVFKKTKIFLGLVIAGITIVLLFPSIRDRASSIFSLTHPSNRGRIYVGMAHLNIWKDYPLLGMGNKEFKKRDRPYYEFYPEDVAKPTGTHAHNLFIQLLSARGLLGLLVYLWIFWYLLTTSYKLYKKIPESDANYKIIALGCFVFQLHFLISSQTSALLEEVENNNTFVMMISILSALRYMYAERLTLEKSKLKL